MTRSLFVTGTDTGVGKTFVSVALCLALTARGRRVGVMKPVETGLGRQSSARPGPDAAALMGAARVDDAIDYVSPYRLRAALAPWPASLAEGLRIRPSVILRAHQALCRRYDWTIVEGAGGLLVPITRTLSYLDLIRLLRLPVLVVARSGLGTINHTRLTLEVARKNGVRIVGVVLNTSEERTDPKLARSIRDRLRDLVAVPVTGPLPYLGPVTPQTLIQKPKLLRRIRNEIDELLHHAGIELDP